jgi:lipid A 3-O-deacylase
MMGRAQDIMWGEIVQAFRFIVAFGLMLGAFVAAGGIVAPVARAQEDQALLAGGVGAFDFVQDDDTAMDFRIEYRHGSGLWIFKPWFGLEGTSDGAFYGVGGILADFTLAPHIVLTPSFGVGAYAEGDGKDLGHPIEFRSQIELAYRFDNASRLGMAFSHISNAGLGEENPGVEVINLYYALPVGSLF